LEELFFHQENGRYHKTTGVWTCCIHRDERVSLAELKAALAVRVATLGISFVLLSEYLSVGHADSQAFDRLDFESRMQTFKEEVPQ
jgi:hypothetical protein